MAREKAFVKVLFPGCYYSSGQCYKAKNTPTKDGKSKALLYLSYKDGEKWRKTNRTAWVSGKGDADEQLKAFQAEMEAAHNAENEPEPEEKTAHGLTVCECVNEFMNMRTIKTKANPSGISRATYDNYLYSKKHVERAFSDVAIRDLTQKMVDAWLKEMSESGMSGSTSKKAYWLLKASCEYAVDNGDMSYEEFGKCFQRKRKGSTPKQADPDPNPLDARSLALLNMLLDGMDDAEAFTTSIELALLTGMREAEICGLRWKDVNLKNSGKFPTGYIHVCNVLSRAGSTYIEKEPKTKAGDRYIPLNDDIREVLTKRMEQQSDELKSCGLDASAIHDLYVTGSINGKWYNPTVLSKRWRGFADGANLTGTKGRKVVFHDLRHTFATQAIHVGADVEAVSKILGHKDVTVTLNIYADAMPEAKTRTMEAMNGVLRTHKGGE